MRALKYVVPFVLFLVLAAFFAVGLQRDPREIPSPFIDKPAPAFKLPQLHDAAKPFAPEDMKGRVWMLNVWASWCVSCRVEHPLLVEMSKRNIVPIVGLNYKDQRDAGVQWLTRFGNPYVLSAYDLDGRVGIDYGVYGVPETFVIDRSGRIRYRHTGPLTAELWRERLLPVVRSLQ